MTYRSRPAKLNSDISLDSIRARRAARRARANRINRSMSDPTVEPNPSHSAETYQQRSMSPLVRTEPPVPAAGTGDYFGDLLVERNAIATRIAALQEEIAREGNDLAAIEILLERAKATKEQQEPPSRTNKRAFVNVVDAEFEVLPRS